MVPEESNGKCRRCGAIPNYHGDVEECEKCNEIEALTKDLQDITYAQVSMNYHNGCGVPLFSLETDGARPGTDEGTVTARKTYKEMVSYLRGLKLSLEAKRGAEGRQSEFVAGATDGQLKHMEPRGPMQQ
jgi:hypothetical protein